MDDSDRTGEPGGVPPAAPYGGGVLAVAALEQPVRRQLYEMLAARGGWTGRDDAATSTGLPRSVAAFHLDKLAEVGVVEVRFVRPDGRSGPGAGRPAKQYRLAHDELTASVPPRCYDLAGHVLADAVAVATGEDAPVGPVLRRVATATGRRLGSDARSDAADRGESAPDPIGTLASYGYEPREVDDGIVLANCPFHRLAEAHRSLICGMNRDLLVGLLEGMDPRPSYRAVLDAEPGRCCVRLEPT